MEEDFNASAFPPAVTKEILGSAGGQRFTNRKTQPSHQHAGPVRRRAQAASQKSVMRLTFTKLSWPLTKTHSFDRPANTSWQSSMRDPSISDRFTRRPSSWLS